MYIVSKQMYTQIVVGLGTERKRTPEHLQSETMYTTCLLCAESLTTAFSLIHLSYNLGSKAPIPTVPGASALSRHLLPHLLGSQTHDMVSGDATPKLESVLGTGERCGGSTPVLFQQLAARCCSRLIFPLVLFLG